MPKVLVIAPHPDDEILGCGGTLLRHSEEGEEIGWLIASSMQIEHGWGKKQIDDREIEIIKIAESLGISEDHVYNLRLPALKLDTLPKLEIIHKFSKAFKHFEPEIIYLPHRGDAHSDHTVVFDAAVACTKWFRYPYVKRVLAYETLSETEFGYKPNQNFQPNVFIDISLYFQRKLELISIYNSELHEFPFPRSIKALQALSKYRGSNAGFTDAESFQLILERI